MLEDPGASNAFLLKNPAAEAALSRNDAIEDEIHVRSVLAFPGGTGVSPVLSGRDGRTGVPPCRDGDGPQANARAPLAKH